MKCAYHKLSIICFAFIAWPKITLADNDFDEDNICPVIVGRSQWRAQQSQCSQYQIIPVSYVIVMATMTNIECENFTDCRQFMREMQRFYMDEAHLCDIPYTFVIAVDGLIFEGVGWHQMGSHTYGYDLQTIGVAFIGKFSDKIPSQAALDSFQELLNCGIRLNELSDDLRIFAKRQYAPHSENPGNAFFRYLKKLDRWSTDLIQPDQMEDGRK